MPMLGHDGPPAAFWRENLITDEPLARCPVRTLLLARETNPVLVRELDRYTETYYPAYKDGHLLVRGGVADQPARYLDIINLTRDLEHAVDAKAAELARKPDEEQ